MSEPEKQPGQEEGGESVVHNYVDAERPGSEFDTREMPALPEKTDDPDETRPDESVHGVFVDSTRPGSNHDTIVAQRDTGSESVERIAASPGRTGSNDQTRSFERADDEDDEDATAMATRKADAFDDLETREVPALSDDWKRRASEVADAMGESAQIVGPFGDEEPLDTSLAASVAAASGELPLPTGDSTNKVAGSVLEKARAAQLEWEALRFEQRLPYFEDLRNELVTQRGDYVPSMATAIGRPMVETLSGEYMPVLEALRTLDEIVPPLLVDQHSAGPPATHQGLSAAVRMTPYGVILLANGARSPFAFPMTLAIDALATGNAVVLCGADTHPRLNETMRKLFQRAKFPDGLVQVVGGDSETIRALADGADKLIFEGDPEIASRLASKCAAAGVELQLVRKAKDVLVVLASANMERAVTAALSGAFASGGLRQGAIERIVIEAGAYDEFRMRFIDAIRNMNSHHAQLASINDGFNPRRAQLLIEDAIAKGARVTYPAGEVPGRWIHWKAAVVEALAPGARLSTECFEGPGCILYRAESPAGEARHLLRLLPANNLSVLGRPDRQLTALLEALPASRVAFNEPILSGAAAGGGVPLGAETPRTMCGPHAMLRPKLVVHSEDAGRRVGWFPYTDDKAYAMMDAIEAMYGVKAGKRLKASFKLLLNSTMRRLLQGEE
ncbi:MAG: aldehyde dehydrogenase family protein [Planctomycetes bacterium]|nr:aldehyde dehydrogenase family protein [Planctomycetota bacterium]MCB9934875.1 aldehyde dehydrogenase family protein [Planctomycetota bacterium]